MGDEINRYRRFFKKFDRRPPGRYVRNDGTLETLTTAKHEVVYRQRPFTSLKLVRHAMAIPNWLWAVGIPLLYCVAYALPFVAHLKATSPVLIAFEVAAVFALTGFILSRQVFRHSIDNLFWLISDTFAWLIYGMRTEKSHQSSSRLLWICAVGSLCLMAIGRIFLDTWFGGIVLSLGVIGFLGASWRRLGGRLVKCWMPIAIAILYHLLLQVDQTLETVRAIAESNWLRMIAAYLGWALASVALGALLRSLSEHALKEEEARTAAWLPAFLAVAPSLSSAYTCWQSSQVGHTPWLLIALILIGCVLSFQLTRQALLARDERFENNVAELSTSAVFSTFCLFSVPGLLNAFGFPAELPAPALIAIWLVAVIFVAVMLRRLETLFRLPVRAFVIVWLILMCWLDLNDNHEIAYRPSDFNPPLADAAFKKWLTSPQRQSVPVAFVVVAEGGGARAGYMTAVALEALRARCSAFRLHHFAGITVSGGSVGAALSSAAPAIQPVPPDCTCIEHFDWSKSPAIRAMGSDLIGPALRGLFFNDIPLSILPGSFFRGNGHARGTGLQQSQPGWATDRTSYILSKLGLEWAQSDKLSAGDRLALSGLWHDSKHPVDWIQDKSFAQAWQGESGDTPALILLATDVASGRRMAISHLRFAPPVHVDSQDCLVPATVNSEDVKTRNRLLTLADIAPKRDPTLLGAAMISARFPLITPAATLPCPGGQWRAVDGGYFENSGLTTALELVDAMRRGGASVPHLRIVLIRIEGGEASTGIQRGPGITTSPPNSFAEVMSPLRAFWATREARADQARESADNLTAHGPVGGGCANNAAPCSQIVQVRLQLKRCQVPIPLGWTLSEAAQADVRQQLGVEASHDPCAQEAATHNRSEFAKVMKLATGKE